MTECVENFNVASVAGNEGAGIFVPFGRLDLAKPEQFLKAVKMVAACWGCGYDSQREFETIWSLSPNEGDGYRLIDAAESGAYSMQVEGLYVRYLVGHFGVLPPLVGAEILVPNAAIRAEKVKVTFSREDWDPTIATQSDWDALRVALTEVATAFHAGFFSHDVSFAHMAIDWLKANKGCIASSCSNLPPSGWMTAHSTT